MKSITSIAALLCTLAAFALGMTFEGGLGRGVWLGASVGTLLGYGGASMQRWALCSAPSKVWHVVALVWVAKLAAVTTGAVVLRHAERAAEWADWRSYLISFAAAATLVTLASTMDNVRSLSLGRTAPRRASARLAEGGAPLS